MSSLDRLLESIDQLLALCAQCGRSLKESVSGDFCSERCQLQWLAARSVPLPEEIPIAPRPSRARHQVNWYMRRSKKLPSNFH